MKIGGGMVFYMHGVLDEEVVGWTSSLALKVTPSHCWILAHFLSQQYGFIVFYGFSFLFILSKTRQKWKVFLPNRTHIISVQKFGNLGFDDFEPLKFSSVQIFKNVHCILISKRPSKFSCEDSFLYEKLSFSEAPALVTIPGWGCHDRVFVASAKWDKMWRCIDLPHFLRPDSEPIPQCLFFPEILWWGAQMCLLFYRGSYSLRVHWVIFLFPKVALGSW